LRPAPSRCCLISAGAAEVMAVPLPSVILHRD
jgi:hypothetical protein